MTTTPVSTHTTSARRHRLASLLVLAIAASTLIATSEDPGTTELAAEAEAAGLGPHKLTDTQGQPAATDSNR